MQVDNHLHRQKRSISLLAGRLGFILFCIRPDTQLQSNHVVVFQMSHVFYDTLCMNSSLPEDYIHCFACLSYQYVPINLLLQGGASKRVSIVGCWTGNRHMSMFTPRKRQIHAISLAKSWLMILGSSPDSPLAENGWGSPLALRTRPRVVTKGSQLDQWCHGSGGGWRDPQKGESMIQGICR